MEKKDILEEIGHDDGMEVPKGYFENFVANMTESLPEQNWEKSDGSEKIMEAPRTTWQKLRPFVYLAAMFAGIWCMLQVFSLGTPPTLDQQITENKVLSEALSIETNLESASTEETDYDELVDQMYESGVSIDDLRAELF